MGDRDAPCKDARPQDAKLAIPRLKRVEVVDSTQQTDVRTKKSVSKAVSGSSLHTTQKLLMNN